MLKFIAITQAVRTEEKDTIAFLGICLFLARFTFLLFILFLLVFKLSFSKKSFIFLARRLK